MRRLVTQLRFFLALVAATCVSGAPVAVYGHLALSGTTGLAEICTDTGLKRVPLDGPLGDGGSTEHLSNCVLCLVAGDGFAPAPAALAWVVLAAPPAPNFAPTAAPKAEPIRAARPRGPPLRRIDPR